jgi:hypothetical protein
LAGPTPNLPQAPYSFLDDLNSAELNEIAADSMANNSDPNSSSSSESDKDEIAKVDEESNLNEHASSGLTVCLDYFRLFSFIILYSLLVVMWNLPLTNEKLKPEALHHCPVKTPSLMYVEVTLSHYLTTIKLLSRILTMMALTRRQPAKNLVHLEALMVWMRLSKKSYDSHTINSRLL